MPLYRAVCRCILDDAAGSDLLGWQVAHLVVRKRRTAMTSEEATDLLRLQGLWRDTYAITVSDGVWATRRHDAPGAILTADTALELQRLMQGDHARRPPS